MIIDHNGIVRKRNLDSELEKECEQRIESIKSMIRRVNCLSDELISFQDNWKRTCEILEVEDLLKHGRTEVDITTDKDFLRKIEILASEIYDVRLILKRLLECYERVTYLHE